MVFKLLRQSCKCGLYSHAGEALPALLPPSLPFREGKGGGGGGRQIKTTLTSTVLPSAPQLFAALPSSLKWIYSGYHIRKL